MRRRVFAFGCRAHPDANRADGIRSRPDFQARIDHYDITREIQVTGRPMADALLTIAHGLGLEMTSFGDCTGELDLTAMTDTPAA